MFVYVNSNGHEAYFKTSRIWFRGRNFFYKYSIQIRDILNIETKIWII